MTKHSWLLLKENWQEVLDDLLEHSQIFLADLQRRIGAVDVDQLLEKLKETGEVVAKYGIEKKERFEREVLPELELLMNEAIEELKKESDSERLEALENEMRRLKKELVSQ